MSWLFYISIAATLCDFLLFKKSGNLGWLGLGVYQTAATALLYFSKVHG